MYVTKSYGLTVKDIDSSCPADLEPYAQAKQFEREEIDCQVHGWVGYYGLSALITAIDKCLNGKKAVSNYVEVPICKFAEWNEKNKQKQRDALLNGLLAMQANFELNHPKGTKDDGKAN